MKSIALRCDRCVAQSNHTIRSHLLTIITAIILSLPCVHLSAQSAVQIVYRGHQQFDSISRIVSIDRRHGDTLIAYGNPDELQRLTTAGIVYTPLAEKSRSKDIITAPTIERMLRWDRYPTYEVYCALMQRWAAQFPTLCRIDTIGHSVEGRLILCANITNFQDSSTSSERPQFFYSSTIHGDELTGFYLMLHLIDTLLNSYSVDPALTRLVDSVNIFINPLANPDGTYHGGNSNIAAAQRFNANLIDLNRNYPDPFGAVLLNPIQTENQSMMDYISAHHFVLSANIHGGSEVANYPWDSFTLAQREPPHCTWWQNTCAQFVERVRSIDPDRMTDVNQSGYICGGDWYVIHNGRQDWVNATTGCLEMTLEISTTKKLTTDSLLHYWHVFSPALTYYIGVSLSLPEQLQVTHSITTEPQIQVYPNPTHNAIRIQNSSTSRMWLTDNYGRVLQQYQPHTTTIDLAPYAAGTYLLHTPTHHIRIIKQ